MAAFRSTSLLALVAVMALSHAAASEPTADSIATSPAEAQSENSNAGVEALTFFVVALVIGVATYHILVVTRIPYTAILLVWGVGMGIANQTYQQNWKLLGPGTTEWQNINPELLLTGFLPILLFAGAFSLEWHYVRRLMWSSLLLAGPGVLLGASVTAVLVKYTFPYNWSWVECLLFGSIFSATDPVAVVAVLKEAGLSKRLRTLVDAEALLNDGAAFVLFVLLRNWAEGKTQTAAESFSKFAQLSLGGPATGVAFGMAMTVWLRFMYNKPLSEITLTIVTPFATYIVADQLFGVSPVLAVVFLGLWMSAKGVNHISRNSEQTLHVIWEELEFIANTLIFFLAGSIVAGKIYQNSQAHLNNIEGQDYAYAVLLWVYLVLVRALMFVVGWPVLKRIGYSLTFKEAVVLSWSGLRGAVGLSLALFVLLDDQISDVRFRTLTFFNMGIMAFLTVVVQGSTMTLLLRWLALTKPPTIKRQFLKHVFKQVEEHSEDQLRGAKHDRVLGDPDWQEVHKLADLDAQSMLRRYASKLHASFRASDFDIDVHMTQLAQRMNRNSLLAEKRQRLLLAVRQTYNDFFHDAYITSSQVYHLRLSADATLDKLDKHLADWASLKSACSLPTWLRLAQRWESNKLVGTFVRDQLVSYLEDAATMALAFCHSHQLAVQDMKQYEKLEDISVAGEEGAFVGAQPTFLDAVLEEVKRNVAEQVILESVAECEAAYEYIGDLRDAFPEVLRAIKTKQLAQEMLMHKEEYIQEIARTGLLEDVEVEQMIDLTEYKLKRLHFFPPRFHPPSPAVMLREHPLFQDVPDAEFEQEVLRQVQVRLYEEGKPMIRPGKNSDDVVIILRGKALLIPPGTSRKLSKNSLGIYRVPSSLRRNSSAANQASQTPAHVASQGAVLGCWRVLLGTPPPFEIVGGSVALIAEIPPSVLRGLMAKYSGVKQVAWQSCGAVLALLLGGPQLQALDFNSLVKLFRQARMETLGKGTELRAAGSVLLAVGCLLMQRGPETENAGRMSLGPCLLPSEPAMYSCLTPVTVLHLPPAFDLQGHLLRNGENPTFERSSVCVAEVLRPHDRVYDGDVESQLARTSLPLQNSSSPEQSLHKRESSSSPRLALGTQSSSASLAPSEGELTMNTNRRKSLAHGLALSKLASRSSKAQDQLKEEEHARTLSGATGASLLREWKAYRQRQQGLPSSGPVSPTGLKRTGSAGLSAPPSPPTADSAGGNPLMDRKSAPANALRPRSTTFTKAELSALKLAGRFGDEAEEGAPAPQTQSVTFSTSTEDLPALAISNKSLPAASAETVGGSEASERDGTVRTTLGRDRCSNGRSIGAEMQPLPPASSTALGNQPVSANGDSDDLATSAKPGGADAKASPGTSSAEYFSAGTPRQFDSSIPSQSEDVSANPAEGEQEIARDSGVLPQLPPVLARLSQSRTSTERVRLGGKSRARVSFLPMLGQEEDAGVDKPGSSSIGGKDDEGQE